MQRIENPFPLFLDLRGDLLDAGYIYAGVAGDDPEVSPIGLFWDSALTIPAPQPLRTRGGVIVNNGSPAAAYAGVNDYSLRTRDADGSEVFFVSSASQTGGVSYQPLDSDLTAIANQGTTGYGRSLLATASPAAARSVLGVVNGLPLAGGTVTGNILRSGAGPHFYHANGSFVSGRNFFTPAGAADPTSQNGDIWWQYS